MSRIGRKLFAFSHNQIGFLVIPAIAESEIERGKIVLPEKFLESRLIILFEKIDRAEVNTEKAKVPLVGIEISQRNSGIVLHNSVAVLEHEIADRCEALLEQEIRRRFQKARANSKALAKFQEPGRRLDSAIGNIGGEII